MAKKKPAPISSAALPSFTAPKPRKIKRAQPKSQSSLGSNAAAAHGYTQKGPTRKLRPTPKPTPPAPRQSLRQAYRQDVQEEGQKGSPAQRGAKIRKLNVQTAKAQQEAAQQRLILAHRDAAAKTRDKPTSFIDRVGAAVKGAVLANPVTRAIGSDKPKAVEKELQGTGVAAKATKAVEKALNPKANGFITATGGGPAGVLTARKVKKTGGRTVLATATPRAVKAPVLGRAVSDAINAPAQVIPGLAVPAEAAVQAAKGNTKPAKKFIRDVKATDPVVNLVTGHPKKALKLASEHPGFTALEVAGVVRGVDRAAGRTVRATGRVTGRTTFADRNTRADATVRGTELRKVRQYTPGVVGKGVQVAVDKARTEHAQTLRKRADKAEATQPEKAVQLRQRANRADPTVMSPGDIKRHVDIQEGAAEIGRKRKTQETEKTVRKITRQAGGDKGAAFNLTVQGITKASVEDLRKYQSELETAHVDLADSAKRQANVRLRREIGRSIKRAQRGRIGKLDLERVKDAARAYSKQVDVPLDQQLADVKILPEERGTRAKLTPNAVRSHGVRTQPAHWEDHDGNVLSASEVAQIRERHTPAEFRSLVKEIPDRFVDRNGKPLSVERLRAMAADRDAPPSYVSQSQAATGPGNYYRSAAREPTISSQRRTEAPVLEGTLDSSPEAVRASALKRQNILAAAKNYRRGLSEIAHRDEGGKVLQYNGPAAKKAAANITASTGEKFVPVSIEPWGLTRHQREAMVADINDSASVRAEKSLRKSMVDALDPARDAESHVDAHPDGRFILVPEVAAKQMAEHMRVLDPGELGKVVQAARGAFSRTVLSTSPSPTIGNVIEGGLRTGVARAGPLSYATMKRVVREMEKLDPEAAAEFQDRVLGRGPVNIRAQSRHFDPSQLNEGLVRDVASGWATLKRLPPAKQMTTVWNQWTHLVNGWLNGHIEHGPQYAMAGKAIRDSGLLGNGVLNLSNKAFEQAARGLLNTPEQNQLARAVLRDYGKYDKLAPWERKLIASYTPFLAWWKSAATFVYGTLPKNHPVLTGLLAANTMATADWEKLKNTPAWLRGTGQLGGTTWQFSRNTPFGAFSDPVGQFGQLILPQAIPMIYNSQGYDWKLDKLRNPDGSDYTNAQKAREIAKTFAASSIPAYALPERVLGYAKDPGKLLNPIRVRASGSTTGPTSAEKKRIRKIQSQPSGSDSGEFVLPDLGSGSSSDFVLPDLP